MCDPEVEIFVGSCAGPNALQTHAHVDPRLEANKLVPASRRWKRDLLYRRWGFAPKAERQLGHVPLSWKVMRSYNETKGT